MHAHDLPLRVCRGDLHEVRHLSPAGLAPPGPHVDDGDSLVRCGSRRLAAQARQVHARHSAAQAVRASRHACRCPLILRRRSTHGRLACGLVRRPRGQRATRSEDNAHAEHNHGGNRANNGLIHQHPSSGSYWRGRYRQGRTRHSVGSERCTRDGRGGSHGGKTGCARPRGSVR